MAIPLPEAREHIASLFIAYLDRAPEYEAMNFYIGQLNRYADENGGNVGDAVLSLSAEIFNNAVGAGEFPDPQSVETAEFVTWVYQRALGREPDEGGLAYYVDLLDSGVVSREIFVQAVLDNALRQEEGRDFDYITNRTEVAVEFSQFENSNPQKLPLLPYDAKTILEGVNEDPASVQAALDRIADAGNQGEGYRLTTNEDNLTGTPADDTFTAPVETASGEAVSTLQSFDSIDGGGGRDTLNATLVGEAVVAPTLNAVEVIQVRVADSGPSTLSLSEVNGAEQVWTRGSASDSSLILTHASTDTIYGIENTGGDLEVQLENDAGSEDELKLALNGARDAAIVAAGIEALALQVAGQNQIDVAGLGAAVKTLTVQGDGTIELAGFDATALSTLDASGLGSGGLSLDLASATATDLSVRTGAGNDAIGINGALLTAANTGLVIDLGEGENTLALAGVTALDELTFEAGTIAGVTTLELADAVGDGELDLAGLEVANLVLAGGMAGELSLVNAADELAVAVQGAASGTLTLADSQALSLSFEDGTDENGDLVDGSAALTITGTELTTLGLNDATAGGSSAYDLSLVGVSALSTLVVAGGAQSGVRVSASEADYAGPVMIQIGALGTGEGEPDEPLGFGYSTDRGNNVRELFQFTGEDIGVTEILGFSAGVGATADRIDFSQIEGVASAEDLQITHYAAGGPEDGAYTEILAANDAFTGSIIVVGVDLSNDAANFVF